MKYLHVNPSRYWVVLEKGEEILETIKDLAIKENIKGGSISGIGTLKDPVLGFFDLGKKEYDKREMKGDFELLALNGNISMFEGDTVVHIHTLISDSEFRSFGGHLFRGEITGTGELIIETLKEEINRKHNASENLNLIDL